LGIEAMEGRWMLSAMSLDTTTLTVPASTLNLQSFSLQSLSQSFTLVTLGGQAASRIAADGGFISIGGLQAQSFGRNLGESAVVQSNVIIRLNSDTLMIPGAGPATELFVDYGPTGAGFDLRPAVITPTEPGTINFSDNQPIAAGETWQGAGRQEGGSIRIEPILREDGPIGGIEGGERLSSLLAERYPDSASEFQISERSSDVPLDRPIASAAGTAWSESIGSTGSVPHRLDAAPALGSSLIGNEISGEWARAMVFEMAGGEPVSAWRQAATEDILPVRSATPGISLPPAVQPPADLKGTRAFERSASAQTWVSVGDIELTLGARAYVGSAAAARVASVSYGPHQDFRPEGIRLAAFRASAAIHDEVFARLDREVESGAPPSSEENRPSNPLLAVPLLAMLVMERVASGYVARANDRTSAIAGPPRRNARRSS
jgi:hypothetical protein